MDDSGSWSEASSAEASQPSSGKKAKGKAPRPPGEARYSDSLPSFESADTVQYNMDQKENIVDRDIELKVVLPGDRVTSTIVNGSKPMMDLLVYLCGQYHLNPSTYTIDLLAADKSQLKFKPNTPIGILEVESVVLKSKNADDRYKKSGPIVPEQTVRVVINYRKTQKTVMRVSPFIPLQDLLPSVCSKCEFDPHSTVLLHDYESQKPLDLSKSLNDLGIRELYALDHSKATSPTSPTGFRPPPLQESCQNMEIKQNDDKRFFNFFRRSTKKKRDQTNSAPATPLLNKTRPPNVTRFNTVTQSYDSNTMPADVPKKRRAPLPPMYPPHNEITRGQMRTTSCVVKSISAEERSLAGFDRCRTGSFQHNLTSSSFDSSLRRTKRKAPLPPSPPPKALQDSGNECSNDLVVSEEINTLKSSDNEYNLHVTSETGTHISPSPVPARVTYTVALVLEPEPQELEEKDELNVSLQGEVRSPAEEEATDGPTKEETGLSSSEEHTDESTAASHTVVTSETYSSLNAAENTIKMSEDTIVTNGLSNLATTDKTGAESITLEADREGGEREIRTSSMELENHQVSENYTIVTEQSSQTVSHEQATDVAYAASSVDRHIAHVESEVTKSSTEKGKTQDSAVQTVHLDDDEEETGEKEFERAQDNSCSVAFSNTDSVHHELNGHTYQQTRVYEQKGLTGIEQNKQEHVRRLRESVETQTFTVAEEDVVESSQFKSYQLYKQHSEPKPKPSSEPKPKPSSELTRDYLPKIGLTTYKIVPQRLYDADRYVESEGSHDAKNSVYSSVSDTEISHTVTNNTMASSLCAIREKDELSTVVNNGNHYQQVARSQGTVGSRSPQAVSPTGTVTKMVSDASRNNFALTRSLSSAPILRTDNPTLPEIRTKQSSTSPVKGPGPSSFYLQMQRRASSMYVTSAIAKAKPSTHATNSTVKLKDLGNEASQITIKTLPSRINVLNMTTSVEESKQVDSSVLTERHSEIKNGEILSDVGNTISSSSSYTERDSKPSEGPSEVSTYVSYRRHVSFEEKDPMDDFVSSAKTTNVFPVAASTDIQSQMVHHQYQPEVISTTTIKTVQPLSSPTGQSAPLSLQKLRDFATPRPFLGSNPNSTITVKRSQSFSSGISPVKQPLNIEAPIGWSPVSSPSESKNDYSLFSSINTQELDENQTLTPELKYRVHSPPPIPEKKTSAPLQSSDPEHLRQNILAAIRSGEAAANLKRITIRSNTISVNGRARIGHPAFSETIHEI